MTVRLAWEKYATKGAVFRTPLKDRSAQGRANGRKTARFRIGAVSPLPYSEGPLAAMKYSLPLFIWSSLATSYAGALQDYPIKPVPFTAVKVADSFWTPRMETNRVVTVWYDFQQCGEKGRIDQDP